MSAPGGSVLDRVIPAPDQREVHAIVLPAPPEQVWTALQRLTLRELPLARLLMGIRSLPVRRGRPAGGQHLDRPLLAAFRARGFVTVIDEPGRALVLGTVAQFWRLRPRPAPGVQDGPDLVAFSEPGYAKAVTSFELVPHGAGTRLVTETRVVATDPVARRWFGLYWLVIRPGSGLIRRALLRAVRRRCQRRAATG